jgi:hypothetical protein
VKRHQVITLIFIILVLATSIRVTKVVASKASYAVIHDTPRVLSQGARTIQLWVHALGLFPSKEDQPSNLLR